ncbi:MAG TPA: DUF2185 domain-containing protein [Telluria sp.]
MPSWKLENADLIAAANKYTFFKPSRATIAKVAPGEVVKLIFSFESDDPDAPSAERMWVLVDKVEPDGRFLGRLDNHPGWIKDSKAGDPVEFDASHIISTEHPEEGEDLPSRYAKRCFVTHRILCDGVPVGCLYREEPDREDDSGWRFLAGDETEAYMEDSDNCSYVSVGAVLAMDDTFIHLLDAEAGAAFERDEETGSFIACECD